MSERSRFAVSALAIFSRSSNLMRSLRGAVDLFEWLSS